MGRRAKGVQGRGRVGKSRLPTRDELGRFSKRPPKKTPRRAPKSQPRPGSKVAPKRQPKKTPKPVPKRAPKVVPKRAPKRAPKPVLKKPPKRAPKRPPKSVLKRPPKKEEPRQPPKKGPSKKPIARPGRPEISPQAYEAESKVVSYLGSLLEGVVEVGFGLDAGMKTFINADGSVDGEIRMGGLPDEWRVPDGVVLLMEFLSGLLGRLGSLEPGEEGGRYWVSIGVRFGPSNESEIGELAELYKRHRGLFQVASYALDLGVPGAGQNAVVAIGEIIRSIMNRRGMPPTALFVRVTWTPDGVRPHRYSGESGKGD